MLNFKSFYVVFKSLFKQKWHGNGMKWPLNSLSPLLLKHLRTPTTATASRTLARSSRRC